MKRFEKNPSRVRKATCDETCTRFVSFATFYLFSLVFYGPVRCRLEDFRWNLVQEMAVSLCGLLPPRKAGGTQECGVRAGGDGGAGVRRGVGGVRGARGGWPGDASCGAGPRGLARAAVAWRHRRGRSTAPSLRRPSPAPPAPDASGTYRALRR